MLGHDFEIGSKNGKKIDTKKPMAIKHSAPYYLDIMENLHHGMYLGIGYKLAQGENIYEPPHVEYTENHRTTIAKELTRQNSLTWNAIWK